MAAENSSKRTTFEDLVFTLLALMLVANAVQRIPVLLQEHFGIDVGAPYLSASAALSDTTPLGTRVNAPNGTPYYGKAGSGESTGSFAPGTALTLREGPETVAGGARWWLVVDENGNSGWVPERALVKEGVGGVGPGTQLGSKARVLLDTAVRKAAGGAEKVSDVAKGESGSLTKGPETANGSRWWFFDRTDSEEDGWLPESALVLSNSNEWREGSAVKAARSVDLFERAGGGRTTGVLAEGAAAHITGGPVSVGGAYWWLVKTGESEGWVPEDALENGGVQGWFRGVLAVVLTIATVVMVVLLGGIVYATIRTNQVRAREAKRIKAAIPKVMEPKRNERWDKIMEHVSSEHPNDWRLAIIEADVMLDELITRMGYLGQTLGDKLKQITRGDMKTIDAAWEAHRVRNQIAHEGSDFILTQREARRVVELYGAVFEEFRVL